MYFGDNLFILCPLLKRLHRYYHKICELFWDVETEI